MELGDHCILMYFAWSQSCLLARCWVITWSLKAFVIFWSRGHIPTDTWLSWWDDSALLCLSRGWCEHWWHTTIHLRLGCRARCFVSWSWCFGNESGGVSKWPGLGILTLLCQRCGCSRAGLHTFMDCLWVLSPIAHSHTFLIMHSRFVCSVPSRLSHHLMIWCR